MLKKAGRRRQRQKTTRRHTLRDGLAVVVVLLALMASGAAVYQWEFLRTPLRVAPLTVPAQSTSSLTLAKEYIYAGDRLVATEEPKGFKYPLSGCCVNSKGGRITSCRCLNKYLTKPQLLTARADGSSQVNVSWVAAGDGLRYEVERGSSINGPFTPVSLDTPTNITDGTAGSCIAYLYRVRSVDEYGDYSEYSNVDLATTCAFSQDPLTSQSTIIRAVHLEELRLAIEAVRATAALPPPSWTDTALVGKRIRAVHVEELRARLDEALGQLNLPSPPPYTNAALSGMVVKAAHIQELRERVK
jgi:hypothetical protein